MTAGLRRRMRALWQPPVAAHCGAVCCICRGQILVGAPHVAHQGAWAHRSCVGLARVLPMPRQHEPWLFQLKARLRGSWR